VPISRTCSQTVASGVKADRSASPPVEERIIKEPARFPAANIP
jgi:hypothetical protein